MPVERVEDAARTLVRAALGKPARDLATTRQGTLSYALLRLAPRRVVDAFTRAQMRRLARRGHFARGLAGEYAAPPNRAVAVRRRPLGPLVTRKRRGTDRSPVAGGDRRSPTRAYFRRRY